MASPSLALCLWDGYRAPEPPNPESTAKTWGERTPRSSSLCLLLASEGSRQSLTDLTVFLLFWAALMKPFAVLCGGAFCSWRHWSCSLLRTKLSLTAAALSSLARDCLSSDLCPPTSALTRTLPAPPAGKAGRSQAQTLPLERRVKPFPKHQMPAAAPLPALAEQG